MASPNATPLPSHSQIYFRYQSGNIALAEWVTLLTVCLAPLITHIAFGYGNVILLSERRPGMLDQLTQFNPITIVWRYYSIVNCRIRARSWDQADMAASNVIFWDGYRWGGSEHLMLLSRRWVTKLPPWSRVNWISSSTLATLAMTIQGIGAAAAMAHSSADNWEDARRGLPTIFNSLALLSFSRLPAFLWLSDENGFEAIKRHKLPSNEHIMELTSVSINEGTSDSPVHYQSKSIPSIEISQDIGLHDFESRLEPNSIFAARLWQAFSVMGAIFISGAGVYLGVTGLGPRPFVVITQLSSLCNSLFWLTFSLIASFICIFYILKQESGNTALPCMNALWYKSLTVLMFLLGILMFVTNALETTFLPNGKTATYSIPPP